MPLPQHSLHGPFLADGGLETTLVFQEGIDLPDFAAFPLLDSAEGVAALRRYFVPYLALAQRLGVGFVLDTPTWRANPDWAARRGYDLPQLADVIRRSVALVNEVAREHTGLPVVRNGIVGPRGDGYVVSATMSAAEATTYHSLEARAFADAGVDLLTATTMTYADEAVGVARAAKDVGLPVALSFTLETDGRLPSGQTLAEAIEYVDAVTDGSPAYYLVNCAHPDHIVTALQPEASWMARIGGLRTNASRRSHAELDASTDLDRGDPRELATLHHGLCAGLSLRVVGGCCGTDPEHIEAIARELITPVAERS